MASEEEICALTGMTAAASWQHLLTVKRNDFTIKMEKPMYHNRYW